MDGETGGLLSGPPYPFVHAGTVIVAGNAQCLHDDLRRAFDRFGDAPVIAVNGAAREVKAFALYSKHPERFIANRWADHQKTKFGDDFTLHGGRVALSCTHVDYWWPKCYGGGGSAWDARKVARRMGFDLVVLCGCPMEPGPYVGGHNIGGFMNRKDVVEGFQDEIAADVGWHDGVVSASGWTRKILGGFD